MSAPHGDEVAVLQNVRRVNSAFKPFYLLLNQPPISNFQPLAVYPLLTIIATVKWI